MQADFFITTGVRRVTNTPSFRSGMKWTLASFCFRFKSLNHHFFVKWVCFLAPGHEWCHPLMVGMWYALELNSFSHGYGQITYHIVLVPKYRYKLFYNQRIKKDCESIFSNICTEQGYKIHAMEVVEDHVHLFLEFHPSNSLSEVVQYLKGGSSYRLFKLHPEIKKQYWGGSLWSNGKFYRSVGNVTADTIKHYIKESQGKTKTEVQSHRLKKYGQRKINDF